MQTTRGQAPMDARTSPPAAAPLDTALPSVKEIPFDYVATFDFKGQDGERHQDVINVSVEGAFVAVAVGYGLQPPRTRGRTPAARSNGGGTSGGGGSLTEANAPAASAGPNGGGAVGADAANGLTELLQCVHGRTCGVHFLYSIVDSGSGRELQNQQIYNVAGLGEAFGERPFRPFARPMLFMPRSTIRIEVEEIVTDPAYAGWRLYIVLHGYKMLGYGTAA